MRVFWQLAKVGWAHFDSWETFWTLLRELNDFASGIVMPFETQILEHLTLQLEV